MSDTVSSPATLARAIWDNDLEQLHACLDDASWSSKRLGDSLGEVDQKKGGTPLYEAMTTAVKTGDTRGVAVLLERGAPSLDQELLSFGTTLANGGLALEDEQVETAGRVMSLLNAHGANLDARDRFGRNVLILAVMYEEEEIADMMLEQGVRVGPKDLQRLVDEFGADVDDVDRISTQQDQKMMLDVEPELIPQEDNEPPPAISL